MLKERLRIAREEIMSLGYTSVYISLYGSQNYGLSIDSAEYRSDCDYKCIVLPSLMDLVEERKPASLTVDIPDGQVDIKDIRVFADIVTKMNPSYLECLASEHFMVFHGGEGMEGMRAILQQLMLERGAAFARVCCGLFEEKGRQMCHPYPSVVDKIERFGYDGKQVHHMLRLLLMLRAFKESGQFCLAAPEAEKKLLTDLKLNRILLAEARHLIDGWRQEMHALREEIGLLYPEERHEAAEEIRRIARRMVYDHCVTEIKGK